MEPSIVTSQLRAAMRMLRTAIEACPARLWNRDTDHNRFWFIAYHTVFYAHLYASPSEERFEPFTCKGHRYGHLGDGSTLTEDDIRSKQEVLAFWDHVDARIESLVRSTPFDRALIGFRSRGGKHTCTVFDTSSITPGSCLKGCGRQKRSEHVGWAHSHDRFRNRGQGPRVS